MKRLLAAFSVALIALGLAAPLQARDLSRPNPGCHRIAYTPPGWGDPIEVILCP